MASKLAGTHAPELCLSRHQARATACRARQASRTQAVDVRSVSDSARVLSGRAATTPAPANAPEAGRAHFTRTESSSASSRQAASIACLASTLAAVALLCPSTAHASELISPEALDLFEDWLQYIQSLGPAGPLLFIATVSVFECIPLFPTQPLSLASGLLFGIGPGAAFNLCALTIASTTAFTISRRAGREASEKLIEEETASGGNAGLLARKIADVEAVIEEGTPLQQTLAIFLLRLTPVVPFSASNYILGLTPVPYAPFVAATVTGMLPWALLYSSLGGAGRALIESGIDFDTVMARIGEQAGDVSEKVAVAALVVGIAVGVLYNINKMMSGGEDPSDDAQLTQPREAVESRKK